MQDPPGWFLGLGFLIHPVPCAKEAMMQPPPGMYF
jgi:hypothetical protein